jgi:3-phenylpropionate/cinnamic acid dioxygenase small subunit
MLAPMPSRPPDVAELVARAQIDDLLDAYALAIDKRDWELLETLFAEDASLDYSSSGGPRGARDEVLGWLQASLPAVTLTQHILTNRRVTVSGDTAEARTELFNPLLFKSDGETRLVLLGGVYEDRLTRTEAGWQIVQRVHRTSWTAGPFPAQLAEG